MSDLRDQLLKAGLVSAEQAKKVDEDGKKKEARRAPPRPGGPVSAAAVKPSVAPPAAPRELSKEESQRLLKLAQAGKVDGKTRGPRRWYFVSRAGGVPYLELSDEAVRELEQGNFAVAESERGEAWLVTRECAGKLFEGDPAWVRSR